MTEHDLSTTAMVAPIESAGTQAQYRHDLETLKLGPRRIVVLAILC